MRLEGDHCHDLVGDQCHDLDGDHDQHDLDGDHDEGDADGEVMYMVQVTPRAVLHSVREEKEPREGRYRAMILSELHI